MTIPGMNLVVIVDDDTFFSALVAEMFQQRKFMPVCCHSIEDSFDIVETDHIALIISDIFMPGMGGIDGIKELRKRFPAAKIIAMSGGWGSMAPQEAIDAAQKIGANAGLQKPFSADELDATLEKLGFAA